MEKYTMFMDRKNQYSENEYTTQSKIQIQRNPYQALNGIFQRTRTIISQFAWKYKKPQIAKAILRKKNGTGGINLPESTKPQSSRQCVTGKKTEIQINGTKQKAQR